MPTEQELAGTGFTPADYEDEEPVEIWPENMPAIQLFCSLSTQWRVGASGPTGLDYMPLFARMERMKLTEQEHEWLFEDIRTLEAQALSIMNTKDD